MSIDEQELARLIQAPCSRVDWSLEAAERLLAKYDITPKAPAEPVWPSDGQLSVLERTMRKCGWGHVRAEFLRLIAEQIDRLPADRYYGDLGWKCISDRGNGAPTADLKAIFGIRP